MNFATLIATAVVPWTFIVAPGVETVNWPSQQAHDSARIRCYDAKDAAGVNGQGVSFNFAYGCYKSTTDSRLGRTEITEQYDGINNGTSTSL